MTDNASMLARLGDKKNYKKLVLTISPVCVCVCVELLKRSKTCISATLAIFWQYMNLFRGAALTSGLSHVHLFIFLVLAEKALSILQYNLSRGARPPVMTLPNKASHWRGSRV